MKSTVTTSETFKYILIFTFLFAAFLALAITYNKVYKLKNETITIIEKYEGINDDGKTLDIINNYLSNSGYKTKGNCLVGEYGVSSLDEAIYEQVTDSRTKYYYCLSYYCSRDHCVAPDNISQDIYYNIKLFYKFNLPFLGDLMTFKITGETKGITYRDSLSQEL